MKNTTNPANEKGQEYKLPDGLQDDMLELNKEVKKSKDRTSIFSRPATYLTMLTTALTLQAVSPAFSQTDDKTPETKNVNLSTLDYTLLNVEKYYPDMKKHLQDMIGTIVTPKLKTAVNDILNNTVMQASNEQQKIGWCIYAIETYVATGKEFGDKYDATITDETFALMDEFNKQYDAWFDAYISKLKAELEENKGELAKKLEHIESNMKCFTPEQVKKNPKLKALVLETEAAYKKAGFHLSEHFKTLIEAAK